MQRYHSNNTTHKKGSMKKDEKGSTKKISISSVLLIISGVGLVTGQTLAAPVPEPLIMFFFGTGLVGFAGIVRRVAVKS